MSRKKKEFPVAIVLCKEVTGLATVRAIAEGKVDVHAIVFDGSIERNLIQTAERVNVRYAVAMDTKVRQNETMVQLITVNDL